jgi:hypothetical protein
MREPDGKHPQSVLEAVMIPCGSSGFWRLRRHAYYALMALAALVVVGLLAGCSDDKSAANDEQAGGSPTPRLTEEQLFAEADEFAREFAVTPSPTPTAVPAPTATAVPLAATATPSPTPKPISPVPTGVPVADPGAEAMTGGSGVPQAEVGVAENPGEAPSESGDGEPGPNLTGFTPEGWDGPLVISPFKGQTPVGQTGGQTEVGRDQYVTFAIANFGDTGTETPFFVDLYYDEYLVQRFPMEVALSASHFVSWSDFDRLPQAVRLSPGIHTLRLVIDATDLVTESDETDNVIEIAVEWTGTAVPLRAPDPVKGVNLTAYSPSEWAASLVASAFEGDLLIVKRPFEPSSEVQTPIDSPLSALGDTFVAYGIANTGFLSQPGDVFVDLYLDDKLVLRDRWTQMLAHQRVNRSPWGDLAGVVRIAPGRHTLRLVIDPNNLVLETDESDNVVTREFDWSADAPDASKRPVWEAAELQVPDVLLLPNLVPGWLWQWDGPIVVDSVSGTNTDGPLTVGDPVYIDMVVFNKSVVDATSDFVVDIYFDDELVHILNLSGLSPAKSFRIVQDWAGLMRNARVTAGTHVLKMVIDPDDRVREADETDNVFEKQFVWTETPGPGPGVSAYTSSQLQRTLAVLPDLMTASDPVLPGDASAGDAAQLLSIADAGYYLITGSSFWDERVNIQILSRPDYLRWIDETYDDLFALDDGSNYEALAKSRERDKNISLAKKQRRFGVIDIAVDGSHPFGDVLNSLIHELGHALQDRLNPAQTESGDSLELSAIREAQAQQFERVFWLTVEDFTGERYMRYPAYDGYRAFIDASMATDLASFPDSEHALGRLIQWLAVLVDPNLVGLKGELTGNGALSRESAFTLFVYLVQLDPAVAIEYVGGLVSVLNAAAPNIVAISRSRLETLASPLDEGSPFLRQPGLLAP